MNVYFYKGTSVFVLYTDDSILAGPDSKELDCIIKQMKVGLSLTFEGDITDFLTVQINRTNDGKFTFTQPHPYIIRELRLEDIFSVPYFSKVLKILENIVSACRNKGETEERFKKSTKAKVQRN
jgi:hypothetical protein